MKEQAKIQFEKLLEIANDIDKYGTDSGDQQKRNIVMAGLVNTENEYLYNMFDKALCDTSYPEIFHTLICGIYLHKNRFASLAEYVDSILKDSFPLDEKFEKKEGLILCAEGLIKACTHEDICLSKKFLPTLKKLFISSCLENSSSLLADKLLQIFLTRMSIENELFSELLTEIIKDKTSDFNAKLIAIDLLSRVDKLTCVGILIDIYENPSLYADTSVRILYLLDVTTKAIKFLKPYFQYAQLVNILSMLNNLEYSVAVQDDYAQDIVDRIKKRIEDINNDMYSEN